MDNSESWKSLLRALDSMPQSTSSEISFPSKTKAGGDQECVINFSMNPLSDEWKKSHVERSPNIQVFDNLTSLPAMEEEEVTFGEKKTFVVGSDGGWRAINTVVELAGIELDENEEVGRCEEDEPAQEDHADDVSIVDADNASHHGSCDHEEDRSSLRKGKRRAESQYSDDESSDTDQLTKANDAGTPTPSSETGKDGLNCSPTTKVLSKPKRPKKKRRKATRDKSEDSTAVSMTESRTESPAPIQQTTETDSAHLVEIARLCELMSKPTTTSSLSSEADSRSSPDPSTVPKIRLERRKANRLQCGRCWKLGTACDTQTPCSPCKRQGRGVHVCRPSQEEIDAVVEFASGKKGLEEKVVRERKELFFDKRGRFCKKEDAWKMVTEEGNAVVLEGEEKED